ncbi:B1 bradykinin receptor [Suricata suricatta]|uniref:B1 bradykinin receptor n=1 Tax=Suricata suricatta TaxID=37032 RepID=UPI001155BFCA|nr:B1 bradykinin receptor [Suricata suricatta]
MWDKAFKVLPSALSQSVPCPSLHLVTGRATCALVWVAGGLLSVPTFLFRSVEAVPELNATSACVLRHPPGAWHYARMVELNVLGFLLPLLAILFFNCRILASLRRRPRARGGSPDGKTTGLLLTLVAAFLVCWTPFHFFAFLDFLFQVQALRGCPWEHLIDLGLQYASFFAFLNSCLNPVIYVFGGRLFKTKVCGLCKQGIPRSLRPVCPAIGKTSSNFSGRSKSAGSHVILDLVNLVGGRAGTGSPRVPQRTGT